jgi:lipopolysaccharide/colanic/teichoic acid biosynthesis glycosyltransferase
MKTKRAMDVVLSSLILCIFLPLFVLIALAVWLDSDGPIFFQQERVGLRFKRFKILKFRTMYVQTGGPMITVGGDSRITRTGRLIRRFKLDELPQFWNVLRGDMSVVGSRPEVPQYVEGFKEHYEKVLILRPGITDLASILYRDEETILAQSDDPIREYKERILPIKLDLAERYLRERSAFVDLTLIVRTGLAMLHLD